ncbi:MAG: hypothetical protein LBC84_04965 [Prevotellaceae bacterium]|nr:hypothetical protein [Prevotellaceae bacterium]
MNLFFSFLVICIGATAQSVVAIPDTTRFLPSEISKDTLLIGDQVIWSMTTKAEQGSAFLFAVELPKEITKGVELLEAKIDTIRQKKSREWLFRGALRITSFDSGSYVLPPMPYYLVSPSGKIDTLWFVGPKIEVTTIPIDTTTYIPFDIKGQIGYPVTIKELVPWIGLLLLLLISAYFLYRWIRYQRENRPLFGKAKPSEPSYLVAFRQLEEIKAQKLWQNGKVKLFYTAVTDVLRYYVASRFGIQAMEQTSAELMEALKQEQVNKTLLNELGTMLETADLAKFAKYIPGALENEEVIPVVVHFVQATMLVSSEIQTDASSETRQTQKEEVV